MGLRTWLERRRAEEELEAGDAARADDNLVRLRQEDPDAARILTATFTAARHSLREQERMIQQLRQYAALKNRQGRMDLYDRIFA